MIFRYAYYRYSPLNNTPLRVAPLNHDITLVTRTLYRRCNPNHNGMTMPMQHCYGASYSPTCKSIHILVQKDYPGYKFRLLIASIKNYLHCLSLLTTGSFGAKIEIQDGKVRGYGEDDGDEENNVS